MKKLLALTMLLTSLALSQAAPFRNLDFEMVNTDTSRIFHASEYDRGDGSIADLLPGWQLSFQGVGKSRIGYNQPGSDLDPVGAAGIISRDAYPDFFFPFFYPSGNYVLNLGLWDFGNVSYTLSQRGDIPAGATVYQIAGMWILAQVFINGTLIDGQTHDISAFAGLTDAELSIRFDPYLSFPPFTVGAIVDAIELIVPDPPFVESDFNGDGAPDVVFEHPDGFVGVWFINKGPDLISASFFNPVAVADPRWHIVGTGNFSHTNKTDLLFQHEDGSLAVWTMDGTNLVSASLLNPSQPGEGWKVVGTGDMNHDGQKDILFQHTDGTLVVCFMSGITLGQNPFLNPKNPGDSGWRVVGTAALTSAGNTDLIFQHSDGTLAAWYMDGINLVRGALLNPSTPGEEGWRVATTLDLSGDGKTDLLFQHDGGTVAVWLMDGINLISGQFLNPANPGIGWRIAGPR